LAHIYFRHNTIVGFDVRANQHFHKTICTINKVMKESQNSITLQVDKT